jgi:uncharacterized protein involved in exopolysaccharide biosynthesis
MTTAVHTRADTQHTAGHNGRGGPPPGPFQAVLAHPFLTLLPIVLLVGAAIAAGMLREPVYTAETRLGVGSLSPAAAAQTPSTDANEQLAATYARGITSGPVVRRVSERTGLPEPEVRSRLDASPVPESPVFWITGTAMNEADAVTLAREATRAMRTWIASISGDASSQALLEKYERAQLEVADAERRVEDAALSGGAAEQEAKAAEQAALLRANAVRQGYLEQTGREGRDPVRVVNGADHAASDASKKLRLYVVGAALAGLLAGVALATAVAARRRRRGVFAPAS